MSIFKKVLIIPSLLIIIIILIYFLFPGVIIGITTKSQRRKAGLKHYEIAVGEEKWVYLDGGEGDNILFIHGYAMNKDLWGNILPALSGQYRVIVPDLPGYGETEIKDETQMLISHQVKKLNQFIESMDLIEFHLVGISMGSTISGYYASLYPDKIKTLTLISPYGVETETASEAQVALDRGENPLIFKTSEGYDRTMSYIVYNPQTIAAHFKAYLAKIAEKKYAFYKKSMEYHREYEGGDYLRSCLQDIESPVLAIFGAEEKVIHLSCMDIYRNEIKNIKLITIEEAGHLVYYDKPEETISAVTEFISSY